ncbi:MAG TPA: hypothetical protein VF771_12550 [Longimicrobiaceae bacterium]
MRRTCLLALVLSTLPVAAAAAQRGTETQSDQRGPRVIEFRNDVQASEDTLPFTAEQVWSMVPHVFNELSLPASESADTAWHEFLTPYLQVRGRLFGRQNHEFFQCQDNGFGADLVDNANLTFAILMRVLPAGDGRALVRTQVDARARRRDIATNVVECTTTGFLEKALAQMIAQRLAEAAATP